MVSNQYKISIFAPTFNNTANKMAIYLRKAYLITLVFVCSITAYSSEPVHGENHGNHNQEEHSTSLEGLSKEEKKAKIDETKAHHLKDAYNFEITHGVGFPLPVIIWDGSLKIFSSSKISHGHEYEGYTINHHGDLVSVNGKEKAKLTNMFSGEGELFYDFSITKNVFVILLMSIFLILLFGRMAKRYKKSLNPGGSAKFLEPIVVFVRDEIAKPNIGEKHYKRFMSFLLTVFFFIWFLNLAGMTPLGIGVTSNIAVTFSLALVVFLITTFSGNKNYWGHIFWMPGVPVPMKIILAPIEVIGMVVKPFSLMIRLYANMLAGHVVLMSIIALIFMFQNWFAAGSFSALTLVLSILELLVAALQAYIFTMLAALYFGSAVEEHHH